MYKVRFHLGRGKHYQHWQIKDKDNNCIYVDPDEATIILKECRLHNQPNASKKILSGENKRPCAWVVCEKYEIIPKQKKPYFLWELAFNPRKSFYWRVLTHSYGPPKLLPYDMDNAELSFMSSFGRQLYGMQSEILQFIKSKTNPNKPA